MKGNPVKTVMKHHNAPTTNTMYLLHLFDLLRVVGNVFTARKRRLRRLCFHRCLSVDRGVSLTETPLDRDPPGQRPAPLTDPPDRDPPHGQSTVTSGRYASYWNAFLFYICIQ